MAFNGFEKSGIAELKNRTEGRLFSLSETKS
jgi:hypothetical protein